MYWLVYGLIGLLAGWFGSLIVRGSGSGLLTDLVIGLIGGVLGGWLFGVMGLDVTNRLGSLITSTVGAVVLLFVVGLLNPCRKRR